MNRPKKPSSVDDPQEPVATSMCRTGEWAIFAPEHSPPSQEEQSAEELDSMLQDYLAQQENTPAAEPKAGPEPELQLGKDPATHMTQEQMLSPGQTQIDLARISRIHNHLGRYITKARRKLLKVGTFVIELTNLGEVARGHGRAASRRVVSRATRRISVTVAARGVVASMATETLVVIVPDLETSDDAALMAEELHQDLCRPYEMDNGLFYLQCSVGLAIFPDHGATPEELINNADAALSCTGETTGDFFKSYDAVEHAGESERLLIKAALHEALSNDELELRYQPRISTTSGYLLGAEVLLRWNNPVLGFVSPTDFIPVAEETGLIVGIGRWVLERAVAQYRLWLEAGYKLPLISVNVSARQLERDGLLDTLDDIKFKELPPGGNLELELTESMFMGSNARSRATLQALRDRGLTLAIDDFGTGYSALSYLTELPVSVLKLDQALVRNIHTNADSATLVKSILEMAHGLGLEVVAEGVEKPEQLALLQKLGCDEIQGFLVAAPVTAAEMEEIFTGKRTML